SGRRHEWNEWLQPQTGLLRNAAASQIDRLNQSESSEPSEWFESYRAGRRLHHGTLIASTCRRRIVRLISTITSASSPSDNVHQCASSQLVWPHSQSYFFSSSSPEW